MTDRSPDDGWKELQEARDSAIRMTGRFIGRSINRASNLIHDTQKAFYQGLDPDVDDAVIIDETDVTSEEGG